MYRYLILLLFFSSCSFKSDSDLFVGSWSTEKKYYGYFGISIKLKPDKTFLYWEYSDMKKKIFVKGYYRVDGDKLYLTSDNTKIYDSWVIEGRNLSYSQNPKVTLVETEAIDVKYPFKFQATDSKGNTIISSDGNAAFD